MRERKPFWKKSHKCWYFRHNGKDLGLDPDKDKAWGKWHEIVSGQRAITKDTPLIELTNRFLDWSQKENAPSTYIQYRDALRSFHEHVGDRLRFSALRSITSRRGSTLAILRVSAPIRFTSRSVPFSAC